jgi:phage-related holin
MNMLEQCQEANYSLLSDIRCAGVDVLHYLSALGSAPIVKLGAAAGVTVLKWVGVPCDVLVPMIVLCVGDVISGIMKAKVRGEFCSSKLRKFVWKWVTYAILISSSGAFAHIYPAFRVTPQWVAAVIAATEFISTLENLRDAGFADGMIAKLINTTLKEVKRRLPKEPGDS